MASAINQDAYGNQGWGPGAGGGWGQAGGNGPGWATQSQSGGSQTWGSPSGGNGGQQNWTGSPAWGGPTFWHPMAWRSMAWHRGGISRPAAIAFTVLGFMFWWPVGLALLIYTLGSGRMGCFGRRRRAMYQAQGWQNAGPDTGFDGGPLGAWKAWACGTSGRPAASSGNHAFDEYKTETLRRLEEEQKEFSTFLERLRFAKDKSEFDQFMADRRSRPPAPPAPEQPAA